MSKRDEGLMAAIIAGGAVAVVGALVMISRAKSATPLNGVGAVIAFQPAGMRGISAIAPFAPPGAMAAYQALGPRRHPWRGMSGWGSRGTPGFGRTGAAIYFRRVS